MSPPSTSTSRLTGHAARRSEAQGGGAKLKVGGAQQSGVEQTAGKTVKCFQTRTIGQRRFGWCLISVCGGVGDGRGPRRGRMLVFPVSEAPHGRQLPVWEGDEEEKKKLMVTFDHIFRTGFIQDGERQTVLVRSEWEWAGGEGVGGNYSQVVQVNYGTISGALDFYTQLYRRCLTA